MTAAISNLIGTRGMATIATFPRRPLLPICWLRSNLVIDEDQALHLIESGDIEYVFDISGKTRHRAEYRILPASFEAFCRRGFSNETRNGYSTGRKFTGLATSLEAAIDLALPHGGSVFRASEIALHWVCSQQHLINLVLAGLLSQTPAHYITRASAVAFLKNRRAT